MANKTQRRASAAKRGAPSRARSATATATKPKTDNKKTTAATPKTATVAAPPKKREVKPGQPTKRPSDLKTAAKQPPSGEVPNATLVRKARSDWGIEPYFTGEVIPIRPGQRGFIVHAKRDAHSTLCSTSTDRWVGGVKRVDDQEVTCLWCLARVKSVAP